MWIARFAWMKASMNLLNIVGLERLLQNGLLEQWVVLSLLRRPWLPDSLFSPSLSQVQDFLENRPPRISPGIDELVKKLKARNIDIYLISGGFQQMINPVASILGIPLENIFANQLPFGSSGEFLRFDPNELTSRSGGKAVAVQRIRKACGYKALVMVGDGATDLEACKPEGADLFICYAGVQL